MFWETYPILGYIGSCVGRARLGCSNPSLPRPWVKNTDTDLGYGVSGESRPIPQGRYPKAEEGMNSDLVFGDLWEAWSLTDSTTDRSRSRRVILNPSSYWRNIVVTQHPRVCQMKGDNEEESDNWRGVQYRSCPQFLEGTPDLTDRGVTLTHDTCIERGQSTWRQGEH